MSRPAPFTFPETTTPKELASCMGWSERRVRGVAKRLGACLILGNRMVLTKDDVDAILKEARPWPLKSTSEAASGITAGRLPAIDYEDRLAQRTAKKRRGLRPKSRTDNTNVVSMQSSKR
jgi:hypothetical protein